MKLSNARAWRRTLVALLICAGFGFIAALAWKYRAEIAQQLSSLDIRLAFVATGVLLTANVGMALSFAELAVAEGAAAGGSRPRLVGTFLLSQIAKYVPGRVWGVVLQGAAVGSALSMHSLVRINIDLAVISAAVAAGVALAFVGGTAFGGWAGLSMFMLTIVLACGILVLRPSIRLHALLGFLIPRLRDGELQARGKARVGIRGILGVVVFTSGFCVGWLALVLAVTRTPLAEGMRITSMVSVSYLVGLLSMLPAGLGVREAFLVASSAWMKTDVASVTLLAIVTRLAMVMVDLLSFPLAGVLLLVGRRNRKGSPS